MPNGTLRRPVLFRPDRIQGRRSAALAPVVKFPASISPSGNPVSLPPTSQAKQLPHGIRYNPLAPVNFSLDTSALSPDETLLHFVRLLRQRYLAVIAHTPADSPRAPFLQNQLPTLALAEAYLRLINLPASHAGPAHVAVIGPTQAGKSSIVNCLCRQEAAQVSPLAGHTVHPQGFCLNANLSKLDWLDDYYAGFQRLPPQQLPHERYECYALTALPPQADHPLPSCVIWDTPDFDSIDAEGYREGVLRTAALADVLLVVLSKDKYADQSVWDMLQRLAPLQQPTVLCLNKVAEDSRELIEASLRRRWQEWRDGTPPPVISLPYRQDWGPAAWQEDNHALYTNLALAINGVQRTRQDQAKYRLLSNYWHAWLEPVMGEQAARAEWRRQVQAAVDSAVALYQRDYLNHPHHYETFQRTLVELLTLLEIPGLAKPLLYARRAITWPIRQITRLGHWSHGDKTATPGSEALTLNKATEHLLLRLAEGILQQREQDSRLYGWWSELSRLLQNQRATHQQTLDEACRHYQLDFQSDIEKAARRLMERLREHPAILNSLRATRATADAASLVLAVHAGGIGLHDMVLAPALFSITSLLTESALGRYLDKVQTELKQRQHEAFTALLQAQAEQHLLHLPDHMNNADKFAIPPKTLAAAQAALDHDH
ncbi:MAG: GTP-binding protein [Methylococcaceae bacterium]|nr:MAG: GTP-binding protein [Methylococcaceae bacterium]